MPRASLVGLRLGCARPSCSPDVTVVASRSVDDGRQTIDELGPGTKVTEAIELVRLLGRGGMGSVWVGHDQKLDRDVAVKFISKGEDEEDTLRRFEREARVAARVDHPHVVQVFDFGLLANDTPYLVMELLKGESLGERLNRDGRLSPVECGMLVEQVAQALTACHNAGVIHRDIKPGNLFLIESGYEIFAKVVDFGIARPDGQIIDGTTMTVAGMLIGTPNYMSPEQLFEAKPATGLADMWALSVVAYESLTGHLPFDAETVAALGRVLTKGTFALPTTLVDTLPGAIDAFFLRALSLDKPERFATPEAFAAAFNEALDEGAPAPRASGRSLQPSSSADTVVKGEQGGGDKSTPVTRNDRHSGRTMGKYQLVAELGHGGMADVFLAAANDELGVNKLVVVKRLRPNLAEDETFVDMIVDEARLAARLNHPNVVQTLEAGRAERHYFIAMEYLEGQPLHRVLNRAHKAGGGIPKALAYFVISEMLAGLHHAHELKDYDGTPLEVVHRDVSPHNVFVTYDGQVKVMDFGIAKAARRATYTSTGVVKGKISYMAPEQACSGKQDRRVDVFAAGILLWEVEVGRRLWEDADDVVVMNRLTTGDYPVSPKAVDEEVSPGIDAICRRALAFDPDERFDTAAEMQVELDAVIEGIVSSRTLASGGASHRPDRRALGELVSELFAHDREELTTQIESQMRSLREDTPSVRKPITLDLSTPRPQDDDAFAETRVERIPDERVEAKSVADDERALSAEPKRAVPWRFVAAAGLVAAGGAWFMSGDEDEPRASTPSPKQVAAEPTGAPSLDPQPVALDDEPDPPSTRESEPPDEPPPVKPKPVQPASASPVWPATPQSASSKPPPPPSKTPDPEPLPPAKPQPPPPAKTGTPVRPLDDGDPWQK